MAPRLRLPRRRRKEEQPVPPVEPVIDEVTDENAELRMSLLEHLEELRSRLFKAALSLVLGVIIALPLASPALAYLQTPYGERFQSLDPTNPVVSYFRVALMLGAIISIPLTTYQVLMFILPGLTKKERRLLLLALPAITILFLVGALFAWFLLIPPALNFLSTFQSDLFVAEWTADGYLGFITALIFWMGVAFETPLVFFVLSLMGFVTARQLIKNWRIAIIGASVAAAFITPTVDPVNMFLVMAPLLVLYVLSIFLTGIGSRLSNVERTE